MGSLKKVTFAAGTVISAAALVSVALPASAATTNTATVRSSGASVLHPGQTVTLNENCPGQLATGGGFDANAATADGLQVLKNGPIIAGPWSPTPGQANGWQTILKYNGTTQVQVTGYAVCSASAD